MHHACVLDQGHLQNYSDVGLFTISFPASWLSVTFRPLRTENSAGKLL